MHYHVVVLIEPDAHPAERLPELLERFYEGREVEPWKDYIYDEVDNLGGNEYRLMAKHYGTDDPHALAAHMRHWREEPGGVDEHGLYSLTTRNPEGHWDYYLITNNPHARYQDAFGGRGYCRVAEWPAEQRYPYAIVTATDGWVARERWDDRRCAFVPHPCWEGYCAEALSGHRDHIAVSLDCHN